MDSLLETLKRTVLLADGAMGSYIFELTGRLSERNHNYEALNLDQPELVRSIHAAYLRAGARCMTTNTFGANRTKLAAADLADRTAAINRAGVRLAREAILRHREQTSADEDFFVLGSVGPAAGAGESLAAVTDSFREQLDALLAAGVDAIIFETFTQLPHLLAGIELVRTAPGRPAIIAQMALHFAGSERAWDQPPEPCIAEILAAGADVVGINCCAPWEATAFVELARAVPAVRDGGVPLSAMPNAGGFERIDSRYMTKVNPEYLGRCARTLVEDGARLVGGCCEVHPPHLREMHNYLRARARPAGPVVAIALPEALPAAGAAEKRQNGPFSRKIFERSFAVSVEIVPPRGTAPKALQAKVDHVAALARSGLADAVDITDGSRGIPLVPPGDFIHLARARLGWTGQTGDALEWIPHFTGRDLNTMGIQSRLMGYHVNGIHNVLFITGDPPKMSPTYPRSTAVFDADSVAMIGYAHGRLNSGVDLGGQPLGRHADPRTSFTIGTGFEPEALDPGREIEKLRRKIDGGADYVMTQPAFRTAPLAALDPFRERIPILVGVMVMTSLAHAQRIDEIPGVVMPEEVFERLGAYADPADQATVGRDIAAEQIRWILQEGWSGLYLMSPATHAPVMEVLELGLGQRRAP